MNFLSLIHFPGHKISPLVAIQIVLFPPAGSSGIGDFWTGRKRTEHRLPRANSSSTSGTILQICRDRLCRTFYGKHKVTIKTTTGKYCKLWPCLIKTMVQTIRNRDGVNKSSTVPLSPKPDPFLCMAAPRAPVLGVIPISPPGAAHQRSSWWRKDLYYQ